jgi:hypothetical protein
MMLPSQFDLSGRAGLDAIFESDLKERPTSIHGNVLRAVHIPDSENGDASLVFGPGAIAEKIKVPGLCVKPCNPEVQVDSETGRTRRGPYQSKRLTHCLGYFGRSLLWSYPACASWQRHLSTEIAPTMR